MLTLKVKTGCVAHQPPRMGQMDASAEMPALSTARGGRSKRFITAHASQCRSGDTFVSLRCWGQAIGLDSLQALSAGNGRPASTAIWLLRWLGSARPVPYMPALKFVWAEMVGFACPLQYKHTERRAGQIMAVKSAHLTSTTQALRTCLSLVTTREEIQQWYTTFL